MVDACPAAATPSPVLGAGAVWGSWQRSAVVVRYSAISRKRSIRRWHCGLCMVAAVLGLGAILSRAFLAFCWESVLVSVAVAFDRVHLRALTWLAGLLWARCVPRVEAGGSSFGGVWDRELDG